MYWIGAIIISICVGIMYTELYGWLTLGGIFFVAGVWEALDDSIVKYNESKQKD